MSIIHKDLADGRWHKLTLSEQMGNIGSEVHRAVLWQDKDEKIFNDVISRANELFNFTINDSRWQGRLKEIKIARDLFADASKQGSEYGEKLADLEEYFDQFAYLARNNKR